MKIHKGILKYVLRRSLCSLHAPEINLVVGQLDY